MASNVPNTDSPDTSNASGPMKSTHSEKGYREEGESAGPREKSSKQNKDHRHSDFKEGSNGKSSIDGANKDKPQFNEHSNTSRKHEHGRYNKKSTDGEKGKSFGESHDNAPINDNRKQGNFSERGHSKRRSGGRTRHSKPDHAERRSFDKAYQRSSFGGADRYSHNEPGNNRYSGRSNRRFENADHGRSFDQTRQTDYRSFNQAYQRPGFSGAAESRYSEHDYNESRWRGGTGRGRGSGKPRDRQNPEVKLSKQLSYILRHGAAKEGFKLSSDGFLYLDELLEHERFSGVTQEDIERIVETNDKKRFHLETDGEGKVKIRANQGHTVAVEDLHLEEITDADDYPCVVHGTYSKCLDSIKVDGLSKMKRTHIHCAPGEPGDNEVVSGMRESCDIMIFINMKLALEERIKFFKSSNNVILTEGNEKGFLEPKFFERIVDRQTKEVIPI